VAAGSEDDLPVFQVWLWEFLWDLRMPGRVFGGRLGPAPPYRAF